VDPKMRLSETARGYQSAIVLLTACKTGVFAAIGRSARSVEPLARELGLNERALETALLALAADGFLLREGPDGFRVAPQYAPYLLPDSPETQVSMMNHQYACLQRWAQLESVLRTGEPAPREETGAVAERAMRDFICGMANISRDSSAEVAQKIDLSPYRRMLDVGGGPGTSSIVFAQRYPDLRCVVFDLEGPIGIAREEIDKAGLADRVEARVGDYFQDDFGEGFDLVYVSNIIHSLAPQDTAMIVGKSRTALDPGGTIILKDFFLEDDRITPSFGAFFSVNMLVGTDGGKSYTLTETQEILAAAGFGDFQTVEVATASRLLIARKTT